MDKERTRTIVKDKKAMVQCINLDRNTEQFCKSDAITHSASRSCGRQSYLPLLYKAYQHLESVTLHDII